MISGIEPLHFDILWLWLFGHAFKLEKLPLVYERGGVIGILVKFLLYFTQTIKKTGKRAYRSLFVNKYLHVNSYQNFVWICITTHKADKILIQVFLL